MLFKDISTLKRSCILCHLPWSPCVREFSQHTLFCFLALQGIMRCGKYSCWCRACSRVRGRGPGNGTVSRSTYLDVPNCARNKLTVWREDHFTVTKAAGIEERKKRVAEMIDKELTKAKTGAWVK